MKNVSVRCACSPALCTVDFLLAVTGMLRLPFSARRVSFSRTLATRIPHELFCLQHRRGNAAMTFSTICERSPAPSSRLRLMTFRATPPVLPLKDPEGIPLFPRAQARPAPPGSPLPLKPSLRLSPWLNSLYQFLEEFTLLLRFPVWLPIPPDPGPPRLLRRSSVFPRTDSG